MVGSNNELYGHVVYGHSGEKVAYIISAEDVLGDVARFGAWELADVSAEGRQTLRSRINESSAVATSNNHGSARMTHDKFAIDSENVDSDLKSGAGVGRSPRRNTGHRPWESHGPPRDSWQKTLKNMRIAFASTIFLGLVMTLYLAISALKLITDLAIVKSLQKDLETLLCQAAGDLGRQMDQNTMKSNPGTITHLKERFGNHSRGKSRGKGVQTDVNSQGLRGPLYKADVPSGMKPSALDDVSSSDFEGRRAAVTRQSSRSGSFGNRNWGIQTKGSASPNQRLQMEAGKEQTNKHTRPSSKIRENDNSTDSHDDIIVIQSSRRDAADSYGRGYDKMSRSVLKPKSRHSKWEPKTVTTEINSDQSRSRSCCQTSSSSSSKPIRLCRDIASRSRNRTHSEQKQSSLTKLRERDLEREEFKQAWERQKRSEELILKERQTQDEGAYIREKIRTQEETDYKDTQAKRGSERCPYGRNYTYHIPTSLLQANSSERINSHKSSPSASPQRFQRPLKAKDDEDRAIGPSNAPKADDNGDLGKSPIIDDKQPEDLEQGFNPHSDASEPGLKPLSRVEISHDSLYPDDR